MSSDHDPRAICKAGDEETEEVEDIDESGETSKAPGPYWRAGLIEWLFMKMNLLRFDDLNCYFVPTSWFGVLCV